MGKRIDRFRELDDIATSLHFGLVSRVKLLLGTYLERLRIRIPGIPKLIFRLRFPYEGRRVSYFLRSNDVDSQHLGGLFVRREYNVPVSGPKRILDLGGNIGSADIFFHCAYPDAEIVTVEPLPANQEILRKNWEANAIPGHIIHAAVSDKAGRARFYLGPVDCSSLVARPDMKDEYIDVDCVTVPQILEQAGWDGIDLLKVDIEGGEIALFKNCSQWADKVGVIIGELHNGYTVEEFDRDLDYQFDCTQVFEYPAPGSMKGILAVRKEAKRPSLKGSGSPAEVYA